MSSSLSRRDVIRTSASVMAAASALGGFAIRPSRAATPKFTVLETKIISQQPEYYCGWPTVCRRSNGDLWVTWSGGREAHVCPFGQVVAMSSFDEGRTWTYPRVLLDSARDDRDSGCLETAKGTLLVTTFTSSAYEGSLKAQAALKPGDKAKWPAEKLAKWTAVHDRLSEEQRKAELGEWLIRSTDGGVTWGPRIATVTNSPHGPIQLSDGRLLYAGKQLWTTDRKVGVSVSSDDGLTWQWLADIPTRPGDDAGKSYHELHAVETGPGRIIAQIRNHNEQDKYETLQTESSDGGKTWTVPHTIGVWGYPSHLMKLRDGRILMTYSHRRAPRGNQARVSSDGGRTWSEAMLLSTDATGDFGYPSTVQLAGGDLLTIWYEKMSDSRMAILRQARWSIG